MHLSEQIYAGGVQTPLTFVRNLGPPLPLPKAVSDRHRFCTASRRRVILQSHSVALHPGGMREKGMVRRSWSTFKLLHDSLYVCSIPLLPSF